MITKLGTRARAAPAQPAPEPVARLCYPTDKIKVAAFPIARSYAELSKEAAADNPYWVEGEPLYTIPSAQPAPKPPTDEELRSIFIKVCADLKANQYPESYGITSLQIARGVARAVWALAVGQAKPAPEPPTEGDAHELWALAQLLPGEGIEDGVDRIVTFLARWGQGNG
jgi:hypothetical protein